MIQTILILLILNSLYIYGLWFASEFDYRSDTHYAIDKSKAKVSDVDMDSAMVLWRLKFYSLKYIGDYWSKPIITCPMCMASVHSFYVYWAVRPMQSQGLLIEIFTYIGYAFALSGLNYMLLKD